MNFRLLCFRFSFALLTVIATAVVISGAYAQSSEQSLAQAEQEQQEQQEQQDLPQGQPQNPQQKQSQHTSGRWPSTFRDWWQTPAQQAQRAWRKGDNEALRNVAPDEQWQAVSDYLNGDFESAKSGFGQASTAVDDPNALRAMFNEATSAIQLGEYPQAIAQLEAVLSEQPGNVEAARNKAIAERLLELSQQSQQQQPSSGDSDESEQADTGEQSDEQDNSSSDPSAQDSQSNEDQQSGEQDQQNSAEDSQSQESNNNSDTDKESEPEMTESGSSEQQEEIDDAREALEQARQNAQSEQEQTEREAPQTAAPGEEPISEEGQATEQWLRQIPDDPDDLLRRKLLQNHRNEYPDVQVRGRGY
jgi:Ca-activated chloride channel homolog